MVQMVRDRPEIGTRPTAASSGGIGGQATHERVMERTTEADSTQWAGVTIWDPGRIYLALAIAVFIVAVFVVLGAAFVYGARRPRNA